MEHEKLEQRLTTRCGRPVKIKIGSMDRLTYHLRQRVKITFECEDDDSVVTPVAKRPRRNSYPN